MWDFIIQYADWIIGTHGIYSTYLVHYKKSKWGNHNALLGSLAWIGYGLDRGQIGYIPLCVLSVVIIMCSMRKEKINEK